MERGELTSYSDSERYRKDSRRCPPGACCMEEPGWRTRPPPPVPPMPRMPGAPPAPAPAAPSPRRCGEWSTSKLYKSKGRKNKYSVVERACFGEAQQCMFERHVPIKNLSQGNGLSEDTLIKI